MLLTSKQTGLDQLASDGIVGMSPQASGGTLFVEELFNQG
jgi:hypothetical protein